MAKRDTALPGVIPPHPPRMLGKVRALVEEYESGVRIPPPVALRFGDELRAVSGSHRLAAMGVSYSSAEEAEAAGALLVLDAEDVLSAARQHDDHETIVDLRHPERWSFFPELLRNLWPYLPEEAQRALRDDERLPTQRTKR